MDTLLEIRDLKVNFHTPAGTLHAVRGVDFDVPAGKVVAVVGESGCGKSVTAKAIMGLIESPAKVEAESRIYFERKNLVEMSEKEWNAFRGKDCSIIFQDALVALNPTVPVGKQIIENLKNHEQGMTKKEMEARTQEMLRLTGISDAESCMKKYPHELSGGMRQRVMIAMAMITHPKLLIADEPTTALDVTIQAQILQLMQDLQKQMGMSIILITHDLGIVADVADEIVVMYAGKVVEKGSCRDIFYNLKHPYTWSLLQSVPKINMDRKKELASIEGGLPDMVNLPEGCAFCSRCPFAMNVCTKYQPPVTKLDGLHEASCWLLDERADASHVPFMKEGK